MQRLPYETTSDFSKTDSALSVRRDKSRQVAFNTSRDALEKIDQQMRANIHYAVLQGRDAINRRIDQLDQEWDIEGLLEVNASSLSLFGTVMGILSSRRWLVLPAVVLSFLINHAYQGWCPPVPLLRRLGVRTRSEIEQEKYILKSLRGDFDQIRLEFDPETNYRVTNRAIEASY